jgi:F-type H+-transporting ATPase subunit epsilon
MPTFHFELISPQNVAFSGAVDQVDVPGAEGDFGVLAGHAPLIALLRPGVMTVKAQIAEMEERCKQMEQGSALDREIAKLDQFKALDTHLQTTAMH